MSALFDVADYLPAHIAKCRKGPQGVKRGTRPINSKFDEATKPVRLPLSWSIDDIAERIELVHSELYSAEAELIDARKRSASGRISNRYSKLAELVAALRDVFPRGDTYDPFRDSEV